MARTMKDMDSLARSERALQNLQEKLEREESEKQKHIQSKEQLEEKVPCPQQSLTATNNHPVLISRNQHFHQHHNQYHNQHHNQYHDLNHQPVLHSNSPYVPAPSCITNASTSTLSTLRPSITSLYYHQHHGCSTVCFVTITTSTSIETHRVY